MNKYDFKVGQVWKNTMTGDRFEILAVGSEYVGWKYDTSMYVSCMVRSFFDKSLCYELIKPKIKGYWVAYKYENGDCNIVAYETKEEADKRTTGPYLVARGELEFEEGDGL